MSVVAGDLERSGIGVVQHRPISITVAQQLRHLEIATLGSRVQRRHPKTVPLIRRGTVLQQSVGKLDISDVRGAVQWTAISLPRPRRPPRRRELRPASFVHLVAVSVEADAQQTSPLQFFEAVDVRRGQTMKQSVSVNLPSRPLLLSHRRGVVDDAPLVEVAVVVTLVDQLRGDVQCAEEVLHG